MMDSGRQACIRYLLLSRKELEDSSSPSKDTPHLLTRIDDALVTAYADMSPDTHPDGLEAFLAGPPPFHYNLDNTIVMLYNRGLNTALCALYLANNRSEDYIKTSLDLLTGTVPNANASPPNVQDIVHEIITSSPRVSFWSFAKRLVNFDASIGASIFSHCDSWVDYQDAVDFLERDCASDEALLAYLEVKAAVESPDLDMHNKIAGLYVDAVLRDDPINQNWDSTSLENGGEVSLATWLLRLDTPFTRLVGRAFTYLSSSTSVYTPDPLLARLDSTTPGVSGLYLAAAVYIRTGLCERVVRVLIEAGDAVGAEEYIQTHGSPRTLVAALLREYVNPKFGYTLI